MPGSRPLSDLRMETPGAKEGSGTRRPKRNTRAASRAARKYPIPATARTVVTTSTACAKACGIRKTVYRGQ